MSIPSYVIKIIKDLQSAGFEAYAVGGCVRDILLGVEPKDWDVATSAKPEAIQKVFPKSFYENKFGTVTVLAEGNPRTQRAEQSSYDGGMEIQITTYRVDVKYSDKRHPDSVKFTASLEEDLARRDFTVNAMALRVESHEIIDPFGGQEDLKNKIIRAVGDPKERLNEDALRMMRAIRFASQLNFLIEEKTFLSIKNFSSLISFISRERVRDEFIKTIMTDNAHNGIELMRETGILKIILPELMEGYQITQNLHHIYDVYEHNLRALKYAVEQKFSLQVRLASLFHDIGKPRTKHGEGERATFYSHDVVGARIVKKVMERMKFPRQDVDLVTLLVRYHLFYYNVDEVTPSSVRRLIKNVGLENMDDLINLRMADRIGSGVPKAEPYKLRHFRYIVDKVSKDPISVKMMKIDGNDVMKILDIAPGPKVGIILNALLSEVLDNPEKNNEEYLKTRVTELDKFSISELADMIKKAEEKIELLETEHRKQFRV